MTQPRFSIRRQTDPDRRRVRCYLLAVTALSLFIVGLSIGSHSVAVSPVEARLAYSNSISEMSQRHSSSIGSFSQKHSIGDVSTEEMLQAMTEIGWSSNPAIDSLRAKSLCDLIRIKSKIAETETIVALQYRGDDPSGADLVNALTRIKIAEARNEAIRVAKHDLATENEELKRARTRFQEARSNLADFDARTLEIERQIADRSSGDLSKISDPTPSQPITPPSTNFNPQWIEQEERIASMRRLRANYLETMTPAHPQIFDLDAKIAAAEKMLSGISQFISTAPTELKNESLPSRMTRNLQESGIPSHDDPRSRSLAASLERRVVEREQLLCTAQKAEKDYRSRNSELENALARFELLRSNDNRKANLDARVVAWAIPSRTRASVNWISAMISFSIAIAIAGVVAASVPANPTFLNRDEIEIALQIPVVAEFAASQETPPPRSLPLPKFLKAVKWCGEVVLVIWIFCFLVAIFSDKDYLQLLLENPFSAVGEPIRRTCEYLL